MHDEAGKSVTHDARLAALIARAEAGFMHRFGRAATYIAAAPGRVNLIGEHTDYNDGFVLPMAIDRYTVLAADRTTHGQVRFASALGESEAAVDVKTFDHEGQPAWSRYAIGPWALMAQRRIVGGAADVWIETDVPLGGGLSSSAALEVATATLVEALGGASLDAMDKAKLCQRAEHEYAGMPCGIMDQTVSVRARAGHALLLDCRSGEVEHVPMLDPGVSVLVANTNVKHALTESEYPTRRRQCRAAAEALHIVSLRDADMAMLNAATSAMDDVTYRRARHIITETARTQDAAAALRRGDWRAMGRLMDASHLSMRDDFEISCDELDLMVDLAHSIGIDGGVFGSRMTGGGFGGCTVSLIAADHASRIIDQMHRAYLDHTGIEPTLFLTHPARGAHMVRRPRLPAQEQTS
ncbi:MAG: galactokinase [Planctomycetes bacterium]|nr:galactokinase [Planctomycetota bacterium]